MSNHNGKVTRMGTTPKTDAETEAEAFFRSIYVHTLQAPQPQHYFRRVRIGPYAGQIIVVLLSFCVIWFMFSRLSTLLICSQTEWENIAEHEKL
jgi:hypothetical protein